MAYSLWGHKESDMAEQLTVSLHFHLETLTHAKTLSPFMKFGRIQAL